jgi:two-component system, cell cycle sensor histidine kinase and response regulator CckA
MPRKLGALKWLKGLVARVGFTSRRPRIAPGVGAHAARFLGQIERIAGLGGWEWDITTGVLTWSEQVYRILGVGPDRVPSHEGFLAQVVAEDRARVAEAAEAALRGERVYDIEYRWAPAGAAIRWLHSRGEVERAADGTPVRMTGTVLDITDRKQALESLQGNEERFRTLAANIPGVIFRCEPGPPWRAEYCSEGAQALSGYSASEIVSGVRPYPSVVHPDDLPKLEATIRKAVERHESYVSEHRIRHADGSIRWVHTRGRATYDPQGRPLWLDGVLLDISAQKRAEEALRAQQGELDLALQAARMGAWQLDLVENRRHFDAVVCRLLGIEPTTFGGTPEEFWRVVHPEDRARVEADLSRTIEQDAPYESVYRAVWPDGSVHFIVTRGRRVHDDAGQPVRVSGLIWDITHRMQTEEALRASEARFRGVFEHSPLGILVATLPDLRILQVNDRMCEFVGYPREELTRLSVSDITYSEDRATVAEAVSALVTQRRLLYSAEKRYRRKDGQMVWGQLFVTRLPGVPNGPGLALAMVEDITARRRTEEAHARLATAVEQSAEAVVITDPEGAIQYVNAAFERITGYARNEALGRNARILKSGEQEAAFYRALWETIARGQVWEGHFRNRRKDGKLYEEEAVISPVFDAAGRIVNFVAVKRDVTAELTLTAQLRHAQKMEAVGQIAAGIAHDFNNLLTAILGYADLAGDLLAEEHPARKALVGIQSVVAHATGVSRGLLTFSGRTAAQKETVNLGAVVQDAARLLRRVLPAIIEFRVAAEAEPAVWVHADPTQMQQVLLNLVVNARDAMPAGGPLHIALRGVPGEKAAAGTPYEAGEIEVRDTGAGMTPEVQARIFEPFFTTKPHERGTGLGLAIVDSIVRDHGGRVEVTSQPGRGSTFLIRLPAVAPPASVAVPAVVAGPAVGRGELVLLAEDQQFVRDVVATGLQEQGFTVVRATTGAELWQLYLERKDALHLLVIDHDLPTRRGLDCLRAIRAGGDRVPALIITADEDVGLDALTEYDVHLRKPFQLRELVRTAAEMIAGRKPVERPS